MDDYYKLPVDQWPEPKTGREVAEQAATRSRREQGLPDQIQDPMFYAFLAVMLRK